MNKQENKRLETASETMDKENTSETEKKTFLKLEDHNPHLLCSEAVKKQSAAVEAIGGTLQGNYTVHIEQVKQYVCMTIATKTCFVFVREQSK